MANERLTLAHVQDGYVFWLEEDGDFISTRTIDEIEGGVYSINRLVCQFWSDRLGHIRGFSCGFTCLVEPKLINEYIKARSVKRKSLAPVGKSNGCSYGDDLPPGCTAKLENLVEVPIFSGSAYTALQIRHRARRLNGKDDVGSIKPENGERFLQENGTRGRLDTLLTALITQARDRVVSVEQVPLPAPIEKLSLPPYVVKSGRRPIYCKWTGCKYVCIHDAHLKYHVEQKHRKLKLKHKCDKCSRTFDRPHRLKEHLSKGCDDLRTKLKRTSVKELKKARIAIRTGPTVSLSNDNTIASTPSGVSNNTESNKGVEDTLLQNAVLKKTNADLMENNAKLKKTNADLIEKNSDLSKTNADLRKRNADLMAQVTGMSGTAERKPFSTLTNKPMRQTKLNFPVNKRY